MVNSPKEGSIKDVTFANGNITNKKQNVFNEITFEYSNTFDNRQLRNPIPKE